jgi:sugar lactone lactonase YvrE
MLVTAPPATAAAPAFERAWGKDVGGAGVGLCTVATSCQAGASGALGGQLNTPGYVATDAAGNVYVADTGNRRVDKFDAAGTFLLAWGKDVGGSGVGICTVAASCLQGGLGAKGGEFTANGPSGIATDAFGHVFVTEFYGYRVQEFTTTGGFVRAWGKDVGGSGLGVCTVASSCQAGVNGGKGGELFGPEGVATDAAGNVYVADQANHRIQEFDATGTFNRAWGKDVGGAGTNLCTTAGSCQAGTIGGAGGEFTAPEGIATDAAGEVYVTDASQFRVQKFDGFGAFQRAWGKNVGGAGIGLCTVAASCQPGSQSGVQGGEFYANGPFGVATDAAGHVYVVNASTGGRVNEFDSSGTFLQAWGKDAGGVGVEVCTVAADCQNAPAGPLGGEFAFPVGVAISPGGAVYVAEAFNRRIQRFGTPVTSVPPPLPPAAADVTAPDTAFVKKPKTGTQRKATLTFTSTEAGSTFQCQVDSAKTWKTCGSPLKLKRLKVGKHKVQVRAVDSAGNIDQTPAIAKWKVRPS